MWISSCRQLKIFLAGLILACAGTAAAFAMPAKEDAVAVMDFGTRPHATSQEIERNRIEYTTSEYVINGLVDRGCFAVMEKEKVLPLLHAEGVRCEGIIDPESAKRIGERLGVRYIVYGNIKSVTTTKSAAGLVVSYMVRAHVQARLMDVETGALLAAVSGDGSSRSTGSIGLIPIGTSKVTMDSVHNAIAKAADDAAEKIAVKCGIPPMKKK